MNMQPFEALDYNSQLEHLTNAARESLKSYGLASARVQPLMYINNAVFRVDVSNGKRYALRIHRPGHKRLDWIQSELIWLRAIHDETPLQTPVPVELSDGSLFATAAVDGLAEPATCVLFHWIDGQFLSWDQISLFQIQQASTFLAHLHEFSTRFKPPPGFIRPRLDWEGLFGQDSPYNPREGEAIFTPEQRQVFAQVEARVGQVMDKLGQGNDSFGLIHADFIVKNFLFKEGELYTIDFDDCGWGYYLYDLAPLLTQMKGEPNYPDVYAAYWDGYTSVRPLADVHQSYLEAFMAARHLASCRWLAGNLHNPRIREQAVDVIAYRTSELRRFLETGAIAHGGKQF